MTTHRTSNNLFDDLVDSVRHAKGQVELARPRAPSTESEVKMRVHNTTGWLFQVIQLVLLILDQHRRLREEVGALSRPSSWSSCAWSVSTAREEDARAIEARFYELGRRLDQLDERLDIIDDNATHQAAEQAAAEDGGTP